MKRWMQCAARLYPASWRARYSGEFAALLEDADLRWADFWDILRGALTMRMKMWTLGKVAAGCGLAGLAISAVIAMRAPAEFVSTGVARFAPGVSRETAREQLNNAALQVLSDRSLSNIIQQGNLYRRERRSKPIEYFAAQMRRDILMRLLNPDTTAFRLSFQYGDAAGALRITQTILARLMDDLSKTQGTKLEVLDPPSLPDRSTGPNRAALTAIGLGVGLLAGIVIFGIGRWPRVAMVGAATALVVLLVLYFVPDRFESSAVLRGSDEHALQVVVEAATDRASLRSMIEGPLHLYPGEPAGQALEEMRNRGIRIRRVKSMDGQPSAALVLSFRYADESRAFGLIRKHDRYKAQAVTRELVDHAMQTALADPAKPRIEVLEPASLPEQSYAPNRGLLVLCGLVGGLLLGALWQKRGGSQSPEAEPV